MTCEALAIGSVVGLALTGAVLAFQVLNDRRTAAKKSSEAKRRRRVNCRFYRCRYYHSLETNIFSR
jgi:hypothetical protein